MRDIDEVPMPWHILRGEGPVVAVAAHNGHELRGEVRELVSLGEAERAYEEDPHTHRLTQVADTRVVVHRSRFEVDLNRPIEDAVCANGDDACWGLEVWSEALPAEVAERSRELHRRYYTEMEELLRDVERRHERFVVLDLHAYNHRREGVEADPRTHPEVNIGTASMDRDRWGHLVDRFIEDLSGAGLDVRENVKFKGRYLASFVHTTFPETGCCLAVEFKKTFMDEHSGEFDETRLDSLVQALRDTVHGLETSLKEMA